MRVLKSGIKALMAIGVMAWAIGAFVIALNGVTSGEKLESILDTLSMFSSVTGLFECVLGIGVLTINEIEDMRKEDEGK